jgi:NitT/TauT family transport system substrate-binding protein
MKTKFILLLSAAILVLALIFPLPAKCGNQNLIPVTYRLKWILNASSAGDIYADTEGYFKQNGLEVEIKPGGPERDPIKELELGRAQFGVASADQIIRALSKGADVVVIYQLFQINPLQWIYRPDKTSINGPGDLRGKTIGITHGGIDENIMKALLTKNKIRLSEVDFYSVRYDFTPFYQARVDLWPIYRNAQGPVIGGRLEDAGEKTAYFNPDDHGIRTVANCVITSGQILHTRPEMVDKFILALHMGWEAAMDPSNIEKTVSVIYQADKNTPAEIIRKQLKLTRAFVKPDPGIPVGAIDVSAWRQTEKLMTEQGLIDKPVGIGQYLKEILVTDNKKGGLQEAKK